jgi:hypothetical protein
MRDSSDDEEQEEFEGATARIKAARERAASGRKAFNTADVLVAVLGRSGTDGTKSSKGVLGHMPSHFPQEVVENWKQWAKNTPNSLGEIPRRCDGTRGRCGHHNTVVTRRRRRHPTSASSDSFCVPFGGRANGRVCRQLVVEVRAEEMAVAGPVVTAKVAEASEAAARAAAGDGGGGAAAGGEGGGGHGGGGRGMGGGREGGGGTGGGGNGGGGKGGGGDGGGGTRGSGDGGGGVGGGGEGAMVHVVHVAIERVRCAVDRNDYRDCQRRACLMKLLGELYNYWLVGSSGESLAHELLHGGCAMGGAGGASGGADEDDEGDDKGGGADDVAVAYEAEGDGGDDVDAELADVERQLAELNELLHGVNDLHGGIDFLTFGCCVIQTE